MKRMKRKKLENDLNDLLTEGRLRSQEPDEEAINQLIPKYEMRTQASKDPIKIETEIVQKYVKETSDRYLRYTEKRTNETDE
jgi:hypothetical protein